MQDGSNLDAGTAEGISCARSAGGYSEPVVTGSLVGVDDYIVSLA